MPKSAGIDRFGFVITVQFENFLFLNDADLLSFSVRFIWSYQGDQCISNIIDVIQIFRNEFLRAKRFAWIQSIRLDGGKRAEAVFTDPVLVSVERHVEWPCLFLSHRRTPSLLVASCHAVNGLFEWREDKHGDGSCKWDSLVTIRFEGDLYRSLWWLRRVWHWFPFRWFISYLQITRKNNAVNRACFLRSTRSLLQASTRSIQIGSNSDRRSSLGPSAASAPWLSTLDSIQQLSETMTTTI